MLKTPSYGAGFFNLQLEFRLWFKKMNLVNSYIFNYLRSYSRACRTVVQIFELNALVKKCFKNKHLIKIQSPKVNYFEPNPRISCAAACRENANIALV